MIRVATIKDASRLAEIQIFSKRKAFRPIFQNDDVSFNEMSVLRLALYYQDVIGALDDIYVFDDGIVKGMMKLDCKNSIWELKELYVDPFFQGEGVGTKLMRHFLTTAKSHDVKEVYLWVLEENFAARKFYESHGYVYTGNKKEFSDSRKISVELCITIKSHLIIRLAFRKFRFAGHVKSLGRSKGSGGFFCQSPSQADFLF